jgi:hypothetical protein
VLLAKHGLGDDAILKMAIVSIKDSDRGETPDAVDFLVLTEYLCRRGVE